MMDSIVGILGVMEISITSGLEIYSSKGGCSVISRMYGWMKRTLQSLRKTKPKEDYFSSLVDLCLCIVTSSTMMI